MLKHGQSLFQHHFNFGKSLLGILSVCIIFVSLWAGQAQAATGTVSGSVVNVRSAPDSSAQVVGTVLKDTQVEIAGISGDWYQIKYGNLQGYIAKELLSARQQVQVKDGPVNARSGPGTTYNIVASLSDQVVLAVLGEQDGWYQVQLPDGSSAYVAGWLVTLLPATASANGTSVPPTNTNTNTNINVSTNTNTNTGSTTAPTVILNGSQLKFEVNPIIENGRTLVPLRAIFEAMGASVDWNEGTRTVTAHKGSTTVVLPIGSTSPTVNGQTYQLEVPAKIVSDRTLAPLRFVGEAFGGTVEWDEQTRVITITSAVETHGPPAAVLVANGPVNLRQGPSTDNAIAGSAQTGDKMNVLAEENSWYKVSYGGKTVWVASWVVEPLAETVAETPNPGNNGTPPVNEEEPSTANNDETDINRHGDENAAVGKGYITVSTRLADTGYRLVMKTGEASEPEITTSKNGKQIVYTFENTTLKSNRDEAYFYIGNGKNAKVSISTQTLNDTTWVTVDMPLAYKYTTTEEANGCKHVFTIPPQLTSVEDIALKNGNQIIILRATSAMQSYQDSFDNGEIMVNLSDTGQGFADKSYRFSGLAGKVSLTEDGDQLQVKVDTTSNMETYQVSSGQNGMKLSIILVNKEKTTEEPAEEENNNNNNNNNTTAAVTIVLDPGHGGKDTGAISKDHSLNEKDVVLSIGLKTRDILKAAGYKVIMTRDDDTYVGLSERPQMANAAKADLFVSIHCDSVDSTDPHGTGTFYYAPETNAALYAQEYQRSLLADLLQQAMTEKCGRTDRGIRQANYAVLRESNMPSALVETAFISNAEEVQLLASDAFQTKAAQAIAAGIQKYVKLML